MCSTTDRRRSGAALALKFEVRIADFSGDGPPIGQRKFHLAVRADAQFPERGRRHQAVDRARVNQEANGLLFADRTPKFPEAEIAAATRGPDPRTSDIVDPLAAVGLTDEPPS